MIRGNMSGTKQKRVDIVFSTEHCVMLSKNGSWTDQIVFLGKKREARCWDIEVKNCNWRPCVRASVRACVRA